jgi:hypothetical protein
VHGLRGGLPGLLPRLQGQPFSPQLMEQLSRQSLFGNLPDVRRRNPLDKKVLGLV